MAELTRVELEEPLCLVIAKFINNIVGLGIPNIIVFCDSLSFCALVLYGSCHPSHLYMSMQDAAVKKQDRSAEVLVPPPS